MENDFKDAMNSLTQQESWNKWNVNKSEDLVHIPRFSAIIITRRYLIKCTRCTSAITFIMYDHGVKKNGNLNYLKVFGNNRLISHMSEVWELLLINMEYLNFSAQNRYWFFSFLNYIKENHTFLIVNLLYVVTSNRLHCLLIDFSEQTARAFWR